MCQSKLPATIEAAKEKFALACKEATTLEIVGNVAAAFNAVSIVTLLREALTDEVMDKVFMPLMNTKIGFMTDRTGKPNKKGQTLPLYSRDVVRDCIIDAVIIGLLPTGNQFNILAERMYPTKEGYTALLKKLGVRYVIEIGQDKSQNPQYAELACKINYNHNGEKNSFTVNTTVAKNDYSSNDQIRGKAERKAKKALYEYITGSDFGDGDESSTQVIDAVAVEIREEANTGEVIGFENTENINPTAAPQPQVQVKEAPPARDGRGNNNAKPAF